jgi:hypothetical protein
MCLLTVYVDVNTLAMTGAINVCSKRAKDDPCRRSHSIWDASHIKSAPVPQKSLSEIHFPTRLDHVAEGSILAHRTVQIIFRTSNYISTLAFTAFKSLKAHPYVGES